MLVYVYTYTQKFSVCASGSNAPTRILTWEYFYACVRTRMYASSRHRLALVAMEGIRKRRAVGRDVATIPLGFALWVSEWKPVSQSVRRAGKSMIGTGALLRAPLNDSCMIDAWLWIVTIEYVGSPLKKNEERRHIKFDSIGIL